MRKKRGKKVKTLENVLKRGVTTKKTVAKRRSRRNTSSRRSKSRNKTNKKINHTKSSAKTTQKDPVYARVKNPREFHIKILQTRRETLNFFQKHQEVIKIREDKTEQERELRKVNLELIETVKNLKKKLTHVKETSLPIKAEEVRLEEEERNI